MKYGIIHTNTITTSIILFQSLFLGRIGVFTDESSLPAAAAALFLQKDYLDLKRYEAKTGMPTNTATYVALAE